MISIQLIGDRETRGFFSRLPGRFRMASKEIELDIAKDVQGGARFRISSRFKQRSGRMYESVRIHKFGNHWGVIAGGVTAPYFSAQEWGQTIMGWHFQPSEFGKYGEGTSKVGGMIRIQGKHPFTDAITSARARTTHIAERRLSKIGGKR